MKKPPITAVLSSLYRTTLLQGVTDSELLERFISSRDETAFEGLVRRHGPMVGGRRILQNQADAEEKWGRRA